MPLSTEIFVMMIFVGAAIFITAVINVTGGSRPETSSGRKEKR